MFITDIKIDEIRHLKDIEINLGSKRRHLILTGRNGSGKTTVLREISYNLNGVRNKDILNQENYKVWKSNALTEKLRLENIFTRSPEEESKYQSTLQKLERYEKELNKYKVNLTFDNLSEIMEKINNKEFVIKMFETKRNSNMMKSQGVELVDLNSLKNTNVNSQEYFLKYMVHLKTQLAYATTDREQKEMERITGWFSRFENLLKDIFETENIKLIYDRQSYNFKIQENEKEFDFNTLSDGFSAIIEILTGIMMEMEVEKDSLHHYDMNGIVMIDEIDTHLHISLQKKIFKVLTEFFPNIQFIITTHSPFILNSVKNVVIYDLQNRTAEEDMTIYPYDSIAENYFGAKSYSLALTEEVERYEKLIIKENRTTEEEDEFQNLDKKFDNFDYDSSKELALKIWSLKGLR